MTDEMTRHRRSLGEQGEQVAADYLEAQDWTVLDRNWRCPDGEIDIVARDPRGGQIVFVEVKTRRTAFFGRPVDAVDDRKLDRLYRLGMAWARAHGAFLRELRVDLVGVVLDDGHVESVEHFERVRR